MNQGMMRYVRAKSDDAAFAKRADELEAQLEDEGVDRDAVLARIVALAEEKGVDLIAEDFEEVSSEPRGANGESELSDEELMLVAGGSTPMDVRLYWKSQGRRFWYEGSTLYVDIPY